MIPISPWAIIKALFTRTTCAHKRTESLGLQHDRARTKAVLLANCAEEQRLPSRYQLARSLGIPVKTLRNWLNANRWPYTKYTNPHGVTK